MKSYHLFFPTPFGFVNLSKETIDALGGPYLLKQTEDLDNNEPHVQAARESLGILEKAAHVLARAYFETNIDEPYSI